VKYVTVMGTDALTDAMMASWRAEGIDTSLVLRDPTRLPGLCLIQVAERGERSFLYWRAESAARYLLRHSAFDRVAVELAEADLIYVSGISLAILPPEDRTRMLQLLVRLASRGIPIALDSNYRGSLWASADLARSALTTLMPATRLMFATFDDEKCLWGDDTPETTRVRLHAAKVPIVTIKLGAAGCLYSDGIAATQVPAAPVATIMDTTAAGDAFNAGFLAGWLADRTPEECCRAGNTLAGARRRGAWFDVKDWPRSLHVRRCVAGKNRAGQDCRRNCNDAPIEHGPSDRCSQRMDRKKWAGMRRKQGMKHRESSEGSEHYLEPEITIPVRTRRLHRCGSDDGQQQNYTGLEEQWQADQHGRAEAAPGRIPFPNDTQSRSRQGPGGARMLQDRAQNEAKCNHGARAAQHVGKTCLHGDDRIVRAQPC
jgi:2-dehydro-3-deoxygluconokinase